MESEYLSLSPTLALQAVDSGFSKRSNVLATWTLNFEGWTANLGTATRG